MLEARPLTLEKPLARLRHLADSAGRELTKAAIEDIAILGGIDAWRGPMRACAASRPFWRAGAHRGGAPVMRESQRGRDWERLLAHAAILPPEGARNRGDATHQGFPGGRAERNAGLPPCRGAVPPPRAGEAGEILVSVVVKLTAPDPYDLTEIDLAECKGTARPILRTRTSTEQSPCGDKDPDRRQDPDPELDNDLAVPALQLRFQPPVQPRRTTHSGQFSRGTRPKRMPSA
jgi:hypothetical protein